MRASDSTDLSAQLAELRAMLAGVRALLSPPIDRLAAARPASRDGATLAAIVAADNLVLGALRALGPIDAGVDRITVPAVVPLARLATTTLP